MLTVFFNSINSLTNIKTNSTFLIAFCSPLCSIKGTGKKPAVKVTCKDLIIPQLCFNWTVPPCGHKRGLKRGHKIWSPSWNIIKSWSPNFSQRLQLFETETGPFCRWLVKEREDAKHPEMLNHGRKYISWAPGVVHQLSKTDQFLRWICSQGKVGVQQVLVSMVSATAIRSLFCNWNWTQDTKMSMKLPQLLNVYNAHMFYSVFRRIFLPSTPWILRIVEKPNEWNPPGFESHLNQNRFFY